MSNIEFSLDDKYLKIKNYVLKNVKADCNAYLQYKHLFHSITKSSMIISILVIINFYMINITCTSSDIENKTISDIYMENLMFSTKPYKNGKNQKSKINRIDYDTIANLNKHKNIKEETLVNYYSEYISQINYLDENYKTGLYDQEIFGDKNTENSFNLLFTKGKYSNLFSFSKDDSKNKNYFYNNNENTFTSSTSSKNDLTDEVISELINAKYDERKIFELSLKLLYGNSTLFNFNIEDLEKLIKYNYITDGQAILLWETLTILKTDRLKNLSIQRGNEVDNEIYVFNIIPIKSIGMFILSSGLFLIGYNILISFNAKDRDKASYIANLGVISFSLYASENFFIWKYFLASTIIFLLFLCGLKYFIYSIYSKLGFTLEDYNILDNYAKTKCSSQFLLKFLLLSLGTITVGVFSFTKYPHLYFYLFFYICLTQILNLISVFFQYEVAAIFQPFRHFLMICIGILNFLIINFHNNNFWFNNYSSYKKPDSFYFVSDIYTYICFSFFFDFLFTQANNISNLFYEKALDNERINSQISSIIKENTEMNREFTSDDNLWIGVFALGIFFQYVGLKNSKYIVFYFSFYYFKIVFSIFGRIYNIKCLRFVYNSLLFLFLITNYLISYKTDEGFFDVLGITSHQTVKIIKIFIRFIGLIYIFIFIFQNLEYITAVRYDEYKTISNQEELKENLENKIYKKEQFYFDSKKNKKVKTIQISLVKEKKPKFSFKNVMYIQIEIYQNYLLICLLFFLLKELEINFFICLGYYILIILLLTKMLFFINDFKNDTEYLYGFSLILLIGIRIMTNTVSLKTSYIISSIYMLVLIKIYCLNERRRLFFTILILFHLYSACLFLNSNLVFTLIIILIFVPLFQTKKDNKLNCSILSIFFPLMTIIITQVLGFKSLLPHLLQFNANVKDFINFDIFSFAQNIVHGEYIQEFEIINFIINLVKYIL